MATSLNPMVAAPRDIHMAICSHMRVADTSRLLATCHAFYAYDGDDTFGQLASTMYSSEFWRRASLRRQARCPSWKLELVRIERFQRVVYRTYGSRWRESDFFTYWKAESDAQRRVGYV